MWIQSSALLPFCSSSLYFVLWGGIQHEISPIEDDEIQGKALQSPFDGSCRSVARSPECCCQLHTIAQAKFAQRIRSTLDFSQQYVYSKGVWWDRLRETFLLLLLLVLPQVSSILEPVACIRGPLNYVCSRIASELVSANTHEPFIVLLLRDDMTVMLQQVLVSNSDWSAGWCSNGFAPHPSVPFC